MSSLLQLAGSSTTWSSRAHAGRTCHPPPGPTVSEGPSVPRPRRGMRTVRVSVREATTLGAPRRDHPVPPLRDVCGDSIWVPGARGGGDGCGDRDGRLCGRSLPRRAVLASETTLTSPEPRAPLRSGRGRNARAGEEGDGVDVYDQVRDAVDAAARTIHRPERLDEVLLEVATSARDSLPGFDLVGISTLDGKNVVTRAATGPKVYEFDRLQYSEDEGPCVDTLGKAKLVVVPRLREERRWPHYVPKAVRMGLRSQMAVTLKLDDAGTLGGLNRYSTVSDDIDPEAASIAELFARHATIALGGARHVSHLNQALETRKIVGQALGILMERYQMSEERAFALLVRASTTSGLKVHAIAREIVDAAHARRFREDAGGH